MKSSGPVFTRHDPFPPEPHLPKAHYSPSRARKLPKQQKKLALSPIRFDKLASSSEPPPQTAPLSLEDQSFLDGSYHVVLCPPPSFKEHMSFSESWPSTELMSPHTVAASSSKESQASQPEHTETSGIQGPSVMEKYIERFRYGRPQSREERQRLGKAGVGGHPFWLTSSPPPQPSSSTPTQMSKERFRVPVNPRENGTGGMCSPAEQSRRNMSLSPTRGLLDLSALDLSDSSHCDPGEPEILQLQERARRLLQKSETSVSSGSSGIPISSEGLGCTDFSSPVSVDEPVRRPLVPDLTDTANLLSTPSVSGGGSLPAPSALGIRGSHTRPEDDILFQWRLRRKMEQARQWSQTSSHNSSFHQPMLSRLAQQPSPVCIDQAQTPVLSFTPAPVEGSVSVNIPAARTADQPALPSSSTTICKLHPETCKQTPESITCSCPVPFTQPAKERNTPDYHDPCDLPQSHPRGLGSLPKNSAEPRRKYQSPTSPLSQTSERSDGCQHRDNMQTKEKPVVERSRTKAATSNQKKKSKHGHTGSRNVIKGDQHINTASASHGKGQERICCKTKESRRERRSHSEGQSSRGHVPPPSPIHKTLGQVVSEVLFSGTDSPTQPRTPCSSDSPRLTPPAPPQSSTLPSQSVSQPSEAICQLMQEAQDSDGLEFEDDPLLLVLRQQRKWVKDQLCEVDAMLDGLNEDRCLL